MKKYRIVEIEAPEGFILPELSETQAEIVINENGYAQGDSVIINKKTDIEAPKGQFLAVKN